MHHGCCIRCFLARVWLGLDNRQRGERLTVTDAAGAPLPFETCGETKGYWGHRALKVSVRVKMPPMGHYGDVEKEIGRVCVQLASPDFKYMSGETLTLEGGMGQRP